MKRDTIIAIIVIIIILFTLLYYIPMKSDIPVNTIKPISNINNEGITELTDSDIKITPGLFSSACIDKAKGTGGMLIIKADWCGHCKRALPELLRVSHKMGKSFPIFKLDADSNPKSVSDLGIKGYPTIFYINVDGNIGNKYTKDRSYDALVGDICDVTKNC